MTFIFVLMDKFFKTLAKLPSNSVFFTRQVKQQLANTKIKKKQTSPDWRVGLHFYSPILNSTRIWRVVIRTSSVKKQTFWHSNFFIIQLQAAGRLKT
jgi:hypothetical protein